MSRKVLQPPGNSKKTNIIQRQLFLESPTNSSIVNRETMIRTELDQSNFGIFVPPLDSSNDVIMDDLNQSSFGMVAPPLGSSSSKDVMMDESRSKPKHDTDSDFLLAQLVQKQLNESESVPIRFNFKLPGSFVRRRRKNEKFHHLNKNFHRYMLKKTIMYSERKLRSWEQKYITLRKRRNRDWNASRKLNVFSSKFALCRFKILYGLINGKIITIQDLLQGCYYTPGVIRGKQARYQHSMPVFMEEIPLKRNNGYSGFYKSFFPQPFGNLSIQTGFSRVSGTSKPDKMMIDEEENEEEEIDENSNKLYNSMFSDIPEELNFENLESMSPLVSNNSKKTSNIFKNPEKSIMRMKEENFSLSNLNSSIDYSGDTSPFSPNDREEEYDVHTSNLELCFVVDCTGSMSEILDQLKKDIEGIIAQLLMDIPSIKISFVIFGDYSDYKMYYLIKKLDFSNDPRTIKNFLNRIHGTGGGSNREEAYGLALLEAREFEWTPEASKFVILIGDSIPYGNDKNPLRINWRDFVKNKRMRIKNSKQNMNNDIRIIPIQCLNNDPIVSRFFNEVGENRVLMRKFEILKFFEIFLAICYHNKQQEELDDLIENFAGLSIDNVKRFHFQLNKSI